MTQPNDRATPLGRSFRLRYCRAWRGVIRGHIRERASPLIIEKAGLALEEQRRFLVIARLCRRVRRSLEAKSIAVFEELDAIDEQHRLIILTVERRAQIQAELDALKPSPPRREPMWKPPRPVWKPGATKGRAYA